jgi:hypothetical protein
MARERDEQLWRKHELHAGQRASDIVRVCRHECGQRRRTVANFLAGRYCSKSSEAICGRFGSFTPAKLAQLLSLKQTIVGFVDLV